MANQYHDAEGKFCSKDGMKAAIKQLADKGEFNAFFKLNEEYNSIQHEETQATIASLKEAVEATASDGKDRNDYGVYRRGANPKLVAVISNASTAEALESLAETVDMNEENVTAFYDNPETPVHVLKQIATSQKLSERTQTMITGHKRFDASMAQALLSTHVKGGRPNSPNDFDDRRLQSKVFSNPKFSDETAAAIAESVHGGRAWTAYLDADRPLTARVEDQIAANANPDMASYITVARKGENEAALLKIAGRGSYGTENWATTTYVEHLGYLSLNPNLTPKVATEAFKSIRKEQEEIPTPEVNDVLNNFHENAMLPADYRNAVGNPTPKAPKVKIDEAFLSRLADQKERAGRKTDGSSYKRYLHLQSQVDAQDENFPEVVSAYEKAQEKLSAGKISGVGFQRAEDRFNAAINTRKYEGAWEAMKNYSSK